MTSNNRQLNLSLIGEARKIIDLPYNEVSLCSTPHQAIRLCMSQVQIAEQAWADYLDVTQGALNQILNADKKQNGRPRHFPLHWVDLIQRKAGNRAISQYFDLESKGMLRRQQTQELTLEEKAALWDAQQAG